VAVPARINFVTLGVEDLERARAFYRGLGWEPSGPEGPGAAEVAFYDLNGVVFALYLRTHLNRDLGRPADAPAAPRDVTLAVNVETPEEVGAVLDAAVAAGGNVLTPAQTMDWGGVAGYFADPDGHAWEVAYNPHMPIGADGRIRLP
jgi:uncharacterized protein